MTVTAEMVEAAQNAVKHVRYGLLDSEMRAALTAALSVEQMQPGVEECAECHGTGEVFGHADDCHDDLCALNGDIHSCSGKLEPCGCTAPDLVDVPAVEQEAARQIIPVSPTNAMIEAGYKTYAGVTGQTEWIARAVWKAMISAAPPRPTLVPASVEGSEIEGRLQTAIYRLCVLEDLPTLNEATKSLIRGWTKELRTHPAQCGAAESHVEAVDAELSSRTRELDRTEAALRALMAKLADLLDEDHFAACEEIVSRAGIQTPPNNATVRAEALARQIWGYFKGDRTGGSSAMQWFDNNKSLGGPSHVIDLCRAALSRSASDAQTVGDGSATKSSGFGE